MLMKQVSLSLGKRRMVTWIESDERLIEGAIVSMKGSSDQWRVDKDLGGKDSKGA